MDNAIDNKKAELISKAISCTFVPTTGLEQLLRERRKYALAGKDEMAEYLNEQIRHMLGL